MAAWHKLVWQREKRAHGACPLFPPQAVVLGQPLSSDGASPRFRDYQPCSSTSRLRLRNASRDDCEAASGLSGSLLTSDFYLLTPSLRPPLSLHYRDS